jgi:outer membrane receptor protein involved in Fe transport
MRLLASFLGIFFLSLAATTVSDAQTGTIAGLVVDSETGETLIGVNVVIDGTSFGTTTDLDGRYSLQRIAAGSHDLAFSFIGYDRLVVRGVQVRAGGVVEISVSLEPEALGLGEVIVEARAVLDNDAALVRLQARAPVIMDGISSAQIRRSPDSNSGDALRRVTGVSIFGGKFAFVRGLPERYSGTMLNGTPAASTEPDRRAFAYDMIPANLLENIVVIKSATPDLPGDFSGGMLQLNTISFPDRFTASVSYAGSVTPGVSFEPFVHSTRGKWDFLGFDDGTRKLPSAFPKANLNTISVDSLSAMQGDLVAMLPNNWSLSQRKAPINHSLSLSAGDAMSIGGMQVGLVGALLYRSTYDTRGIHRRALEDGADNLRFDLYGSQYRYNVNWGGLLNLSVRPSAHHSFGIKNFYSRMADDSFTDLEGMNWESNFDQYMVAMHYLARDVYTGQLTGEHFFPLAGQGRGIQVRWDGYYNNTRRNEPDYRRLTYNRNAGEDEDRFAAVFGDVREATGGRFYSDLDERSAGAVLHVTVPVMGMRVSTGGLLDRREREFQTRLIGAATPRRGFDFALLRMPLDAIFDPANFHANGFSITESRIASSYNASQDISAGYVMVDTPVSPISRRIRLVGGVRVEHAEQNVMLLRADSLRVNRPDTDFLPSVNLTYRLSDQTNVRFAYSRNVNRPELREISPYSYYDFETQTTFYGNENLVRSTIQNFDARVETFPGMGQMLSASAFYKHFRDPIEAAVVSGSSLGADRTMVNSEQATNYGVELEARYGIGFLASRLAASSVVGNYTRVWSEVSNTPTPGFVSRDGRALQGQAPYVVNLGLNLVEASSRTSLSVLYNRIGPRIAEVSSGFEADILEEPRDILDVVITQPIRARYELRFAARDVLGGDQTFSQDGVVVRSNERFATYSLGVSLRF